MSCILLLVFSSAGDLTASSDHQSSVGYTSLLLLVAGATEAAAVG